jgi:hypothetical protein
VTSWALVTSFESIASFRTASHGATGRASDGAISSWDFKESWHTFFTDVSWAFSAVGGTITSIAEPRWDVLGVVTSHKVSSVGTSSTLEGWWVRCSSDHLASLTVFGSGTFVGWSLS